MAKRIRVGNSKTCIAYLRVSTDANRQALGVEAQRRAIQDWAIRAGVEVLEWFTEEVSGGAPLDKRPVLLTALASVAAHGAGKLVVQRLDRFSRDPLTAALAELELQKHGAVVECADGAGSGSDPTAELVRGILLAVAKFEKAIIATRIRAALAVKKSRGELTGSAPRGMRRGANNKTLEVDPREASAVARIRALRASGLSIRGVQAAAAQDGVVSRTGRPFTSSAIHTILNDAPSQTPNSPMVVQH